MWGLVGWQHLAVTGQDGESTFYINFDMKGSVDKAIIKVHYIGND